MPISFGTRWLALCHGDQQCQRVVPSRHQVIDQNNGNQPSRWLLYMSNGTCQQD